MTVESSPNITGLLVAWGRGDRLALAALTPIVQRELRRLAAHYMAGEHPGHLLQPTALVNEAYMRLVDWNDVQWADRAHFFGMAANMMRRVLVDYARSSRRAKRGGGASMVPLSEADGIPLPEASDVVALDAALGDLERIAPRQSRVIELRYFAGFEPAGNRRRAARFGRHRTARSEPGAGPAVPRVEQTRGLAAQGRAAICCRVSFDSGMFAGGPSNGETATGFAIPTACGMLQPMVPLGGRWANVRRKL